MPEVFATPEELLAAVGREEEYVEQLPFSAAVRDLADLVTEFATIAVTAHGVPLEVFRSASVSELVSNVSDDGQKVWLSAKANLGGHTFALYSKHFPTTESTPES